MIVVVVIVIMVMIIVVVVIMVVTLGLVGAAFGHCGGESESRTEGQVGALQIALYRSLISGQGRHPTHLVQRLATLVDRHLDSNIRTIHDPTSKVREVQRDAEISGLRLRCPLASKEGCAVVGRVGKVREGGGAGSRRDNHGR